MIPIADLAVGQRVEWREGGGPWSFSYHRGVVERLSASTAWLKPDRRGEPVTRRANRGGFVDVTVLTAHDLAMEAWQAAKPSTVFVRVSVMERHGDRDTVRLDERNALDSKLDAAAVLAQIADECERLRAWFAAKPNAVSP